MRKHLAQALTFLAELLWPGVTRGSWVIIVREPEDLDITQPAPPVEDATEPYRPAQGIW